MEKLFGNVKVHPDQLCVNCGKHKQTEKYPICETCLSALTNNSIIGDSLDKLKLIPDNSVDAVVTDPPYFLTPSGTEFTNGFMDSEWDGVKNLWKYVWVVKNWKIMKTQIPPMAFIRKKDY